MNNNTQRTTFWQFLQEHTIEIPIIQRDYAQGRKGKEKLREKFLADLKSALDSTLPNNEKELKLDFVYGSVENGNLNPLDGQQRLTTLWLLHWYIAYKAGKLEENKETFKRFTYETRVSSREFCEKLSNFTELQPDGIGIVEHITNQTWFFSAWKQDPTIQAMLNMLGGTEVKEKDIDIKDGIEELFDNLESEKYIAYWETLIKNDCPIIFYYLPLYELKLSDDLYIKMNARGKQLTSFENFKADLVGHIKGKKWEENVLPQDTIAHKLDTTWTDIFWKNKSEENKIDEIYFAFLNHYFLNALITAKKDGDYVLKGENWEKDNKTFQYLNGIKEYSSFDIYNPIEGNREVLQESVYTGLEKTLNNFSNSFKDKPKKEEINDLFLPIWDDDKFRFIPEYEDNPKYKEDKNQPKFIPTTLTQSQRVVFHAICRYFKYDTYDETTLKQWMRVVWNVVENSNADMIGTMRLIDDLAEYSHNIYCHLKDRDISKDAANEQMKEEKEKSELILDKNLGDKWILLIIKAESQQFFRGRITSLLEAGNKNYENVVEILELCENNITKLNKDCLKKILTYIDSNHLPLCCKIDNELHIGWKQNIIYGKAKSAVIEFFRNRFNEQEDNSSWSDWKKRLIEHYDELNPHEGNRTIRKYNGWWSDYIFLYEYGDVRYARLLSGNRPELIAYLHNKGVIEINNIFEGSNDCGNLWVEIKNDWLKENQITIESRLIRLLFGHNNELLVRLWQSNGWTINEKDFIKIAENDKPIECQICNILKPYEEA